MWPLSAVSQRAATRAAPTSRTEGAQENKKPPNPSLRNRKAEVFLRTLSVEELGRVTVPGQVSWLSGHRLLLRLPFPQRGKVAVRQVTNCEDLARRSQWRDRGRFSRPSLFPRFVPGHHRNKSFQRTTTSRKTNISLKGCQAPSPATPMRRRSLQRRGTACRPLAGWISHPPGQGKPYSYAFSEQSLMPAGWGRPESMKMRRPSWSAAAKLPPWNSSERR